MRLDITGPHDIEEMAAAIEVRLSKRNLLSLLSKLDMEDSARTLETTEVWVNDKLARPTQFVLRVISEDDTEHYHRETRPARGMAGMMHPDTERAIMGMYGGQDK